MAKTWATYTMGFADLTDDQRVIIERNLDQLRDKFNALDIDAQDITSDSGEL